MNKKKNLIGYIIFFTMTAFLIAALVSFLAAGPVAIYTRILLILAGVFIVLAVIFNLDIIKDFFKRTSNVTGAYKIIQFAIIVGVLIFVYLLSDMFVWKVDLTKAKLYSISQQSEEIIAKVTNEMEILLFKPQNLPANRYSGIFEYQENILRTIADKNKKIKVKIIDPQQDPVTASDNDVIQSEKNLGLVVFNYEGKRSRVTFYEIFNQNKADFRLNGEKSYVTAIKSLLFSSVRKVYTTFGHGELNWDSTEMDGYRYVLRGMANEKIAIKDVDLSKHMDVPTDCGILIIGNPTRMINPNDMDKIKAYFAKGGSILVLMDYGYSIFLNDILREVGLNVPINNIIIEDTPSSPNSPMDFSPNIQYHPEITRLLLKLRLNVNLSTALSIINAPDIRPKGFTYDVIPLLYTSPRAYAEVSTEQLKNKKVRYDTNQDWKGQLVPAYAAMRLKTLILSNDNEVTTNFTESRMVVFGDKDFANDLNVQTGGNYDLFMNSINYLLQRDAEMNIRPKEITSSSVVFKPWQKRILIVLLFVIFFAYLIPGLVVVYMRRSKVKD